MRTNNYHDFVGEMMGTAILVFFGCGAVASGVLFSANAGLMQVAVVWGMAVALAIYATRHLSCAHLNPAVSLAMVVAGRMSMRKLPIYLLAQFVGALLAAVLLYLLMEPSIAHFEQSHQILRGSPNSIQTAMIFGEFYPNPAFGEHVVIHTAGAFLAEAIGTFALVCMIFSLTEGCNLGRPDNALAPLFIGVTVSMIIAVIAPLTQAGLNPARDLAPRLFSIFAGWGDAALQGDGYGSLLVYVLGPVTGAIIAALLFTRVIEPLMNNKPCYTCIKIEENHHET